MHIYDSMQRRMRIVSELSSCLLGIHIPVNEDAGKCMMGVDYIRNPGRLRLEKSNSFEGSA